MQRFAGCCLFALSAWALLAPGASAQGVADAGVASAAQLAPPQLLELAQASYPEEAQQLQLEASVTLQLDIDVDGTVTGAEVLTSAGHGFDEAARDALLRSRFTPALRAGVAVHARIRFSYAFVLPPAAAVSTGASAAPPPPPTTATRPPVAAIAEPPAPVEVEVRGVQTEAQRLQQSAEAIQVVSTKVAKRQTADLGEVLARTQGVAVRRDGGLGSDARLSLNGLYDDQVRLFVDGVPLDSAGFPFGLANMPVNLVERIEVYRGVVPIRFGADALGGAINVVTNQHTASSLDASYQVGSFGTHRLSLDGHYRHQPSGFIASAAASLDLAKNDYKIDVLAPDSDGVLQPARVRRFHDAYRAFASNLELGVVDRAWAKRLTLKLFGSTYYKELQHNVIMTAPYGAVHSGASVFGATAQYAVALRSNVELQLMGNFSHRNLRFVDKSRWVYDWFGERGLRRRVGGEISNQPHDQTTWDNSGFGRALASWHILPGHDVRISLTPMYTTRTGDDLFDSRDTLKPQDPLNARRNLFSLVGGLEYEVNLVHDRLSNIAFVKDYFYSAHTDEPQPRKRPNLKSTSDSHTQGGGDALRFRFTPWLDAKLSYEYATRLPRPDELFGDGMLVNANLDLRPERSHNGNLGLRFEHKRTPLGELIVDINSFVRYSERLIVLVGADRSFVNQNVYTARGFGIENALAWLSPGRFVGIDGTLTWQDIRNVSDDGRFAAFKGDRIPNRPYLFASYGASLRFDRVFTADDTLTPFYSGRYVHSFYRSWESQGLRETKQTVDSQVSHSLGISWLGSFDFGPVTATFEVDNLTDAKLFDNFGVQRPGRAFYAKVSGGLR